MVLSEIKFHCYTLRMDPYFRPILLSTLIVTVFNTVLIIPMAGAPLVSYFTGGFLSVLFFKNEMKLKKENYEIKVSDVSVLGIATGALVGSILTLIMTFRLKDPELRQAIIDTINEAMRMRSDAGFEALDDLGPMFYLVTGLVTIFICSLISFFGSLATLPFINKAQK